MPSGLSGQPRIPQLSGEDVAAWCRDQHLTQHQLAELLGMTQRNITVWVQEERGPPPWYVAAVLHYLECEGIIREYLEEIRARAEEQTGARPGATTKTAAAAALEERLRLSSDTEVGA